MATTKKTATKKVSIDDNIIISKFMTDVLEQNHEPKNIYLFCQKHKMDETDFYAFFGSFENLKQTIWEKFFENALATIQNDANFNSFSDKDKLLTLYFTLFEILTLNRTYVLFYLKENRNGLKNLKDLKRFRTHFKDFVKDIISAQENPIYSQLNKIKEPTYAEGAWLQFLFLLKFWIEDTSKGFEKTDVLIEKSVTTVVGLFDTKQFENLFDLGKFLWKEKNI
jgi:hypothetical protein